MPGIANVIGWAGQNAKTLATFGAIGAGAAVALNMVDGDNSASRNVPKYGFYATAGSGAAWGIGYLLRGQADASRAVAMLGGLGRALTPAATGVLAGGLAVKLLD